jgi:hypothetical protein
MLLKAYDVTAILLGCTLARPTLNLIDSYAYTQSQMQTQYKQQGYSAGNTGYSAGNMGYNAGNMGYSAGDLHQSPQRYTQNTAHAQQQGYMPANQPGYVPAQQQGYGSATYRTEQSAFAQPKMQQYHSDKSFDHSMDNNNRGAHITAQNMNLQDIASHGLGSANSGSSMNVYEHASSVMSRAMDPHVYSDALGPLDVKEPAILPPSALAEGVEDVANGAWD